MNLISVAMFALNVNVDGNSRQARVNGCAVLLCCGVCVACCAVLCCGVVCCGVVWCGVVRVVRCALRDVFTQGS